MRVIQFQSTSILLYNAFISHVTGEGFYIYGGWKSVYVFSTAMVSTNYAKWCYLFCVGEVWGGGEAIR